MALRSWLLTLGVIRLSGSSGKLMDLCASSAGFFEKSPNSTVVPRRLYRVINILSFLPFFNLARADPAYDSRAGVCFPISQRTLGVRLQ